MWMELITNDTRRNREIGTSGTTRVTFGDLQQLAFASGCRDQVMRAVFGQNQDGQVLVVFGRGGRFLGEVSFDGLKLHWKSH